jgi:SAM-dependent methyltransferase
MPERSTTIDLRDCGDANMLAGRGPGQLPWYEFATRFTACRTVLDAGCGSGKGLDLLAANAREVRGQDLDERLGREGVFIGPLEAIPSCSFEVVTSIDVIEHVEDVRGFLENLRRIATVGIFLTTPNWTAGRCRWPYHLREYKPSEFYELLRPMGRCQFFKGTPSGDEVYPIENEALFAFQNEMRIWWPTSFPARCLNLVLPPRLKIHSHLAAWIEFNDH